MGFKSKDDPCLDVVRFDERYVGFVEKEVNQNSHIKGNKNPEERVNFLAEKGRNLCNKLDESTKTPQVSY